MGRREALFIQFFLPFLALQSSLKDFGAAGGTAERCLSCSTLRSTAAPPHPIPGPGRRPRAARPAAPRPAAPPNISRCKQPNGETRRDNTSQSGAADSGFPPPFAPPPVGNATAPLSALPTPPPIPGGGSPAPILAGMKWSKPPRRRRLSPCHPHPRPSHTHSSLSQSSSCCCC